MEIIESNHPKAGSLQCAVQEGAQTDPEYKETQLSGQPVAALHHSDSSSPVFGTPSFPASALVPFSTAS